MKNNDEAPHYESRRATLLAFYGRRMRKNELLLRQLYERLLVTFSAMSRAHAEASRIFDFHQRKGKPLRGISDSISETYWQSVGVYRRNQRIFLQELTNALLGIDTVLRKARLWKKRLARIDSGRASYDLLVCQVQRERSYEFLRMIIRMQDFDWQMMGDLALQSKFLRDFDESDGDLDVTGSSNNPTGNRGPISGQSTALVRFTQIQRTN